MVTYNVYFGTTSGDLELVEVEITETEIGIPVANVLDYGTTYYWRVDTVNEFGTTVGDEWSFTTLTFLAPADIVTYKRLVMFMNNRLYYEDIG